MLRSASAAALALALLAGSAGAQQATARKTARPADEPGRASQKSAHPGRAPDEPSVGPEETDTQAGEDARVERARANRLVDAEIALAPVREVRRATRHTAVIGGRSIAYTATAGTLTIRNDEGKPTASMFYVAYTAGGGAPDPHRPVTFFYNGGPGSSTMWLHMGSLGPVRVTTDSPQATAGPPFRYGNNPDSLLDTSDLVFLDAVGTGFSRPLGDTKLEAFWGTDPDIDAFARGIERYLTANGRWNSPKFLFGESYGTTRSAGLSYRLAQDGAQLNGVILLSSILNYGRRDPGFDRELVNYIPTYAAAAAYHHKINGSADPAFLQQVRAWADGPYAHALSEGQTLSDAERQQVAQQMSAYTGLSTRFILDSDLRVEPGAFRKELLRDQRRTLGRYDARFTGIDVSAAGDSEEFDPSDTGITGAFVSTFHDYLARDLDFSTELTYRPTYYQNGLQWSFNHRAPGARGPYGGTNQADVAQDLSAAMRENPHLQVYSLNGVYDMATPFFGTEYDLNHMQLDRTLHANLHFAYYPSGHMVYLNQEAAHEMKADLVRFYGAAAPR
ncbi:MAG: peptidase S10 [Caulobacteraceae bacterium]|nr:peptidase S10 [Caulobacter sp.]